MFRNYFKTAWRSIKASKGYSAINILGLAAGMAVALLIGLWVHYEYSYDRWLPGYADLYQVKINFKKADGQVRTQDAVSLPISDVLRGEVSGVRAVAESDWMLPHDLVVGERKLYLGGAMIGKDFLTMFRYPLLKGSETQCLADPYSIVLTQSTARALFGSTDPMDKMVRIDNRHDLKVTGILQDLPGNSSLQFNFLVPFSFKELTEDNVKAGRTKWTSNSYQIFVALNPHTSYGQVAGKIKDLIAGHSPQLKKGHPELILHPLKDWRLYTEFRNGAAVGGFVDYVRLFSIIGVLVLLIACINFMNLSTARSGKRAREVGVRKAIGSLQRDLVAQFLTESVMTSLLSFLVAIGLVLLALPAFNTLTKSDIHIPYGNPLFWAIMAGYVLITGLLAGSRPAFYLSSFQPVKVLKGTIHTGRAATLPRKILVVLQFSCSIGLVVSTIIVYRQIQFARARPTGYSQDRLMMSDMSEDLNRNYPSFRDELLQTGMVEAVSCASSPVTGIYYHTAVQDWPGKMAGEDALSIGAIGVSGGYFGTVGMQLVAGRDFSGNFQADSATVILNESAVKRLNLQQPIGQTIVWNSTRTVVTIVGIVKDAVMESPFTPVSPLVFYTGRSFNNVMYRLSPGIGSREAVTRLTGIFSKYNPAYPYNYHFVDEAYAAKFDLEVLIGRLAGIFAGLAIFISCLGLFGLAAYMAEQRSKEISIRKVLGASVPRLWMLLSGDFLVLVVISCVIAAPVSWYYLQHWLQGYEYRILIGPGVFIMAGLLAILITLVTVSFQAIRAAVANPVKSLRAE